MFASPLLVCAGTATSVSQFGFTWTFSQAKTVGQYANGDWWVVGPVTITSITPACTTDATGWTRNGTMINPAPGTLSPAQGFDSSVAKYAWYDGSFNVAPSYKGSALVVPAGTSVVSTVSMDVPNTNTSNPQLADGAVLTVVGSEPPTGSFRPPMVGTDKTHRWNKSSLNYGILQKLAPVPSTPNLVTAVEPRFERPWFAIAEGASVQSMSPANNMPKYGRDQAQLLSLGLLSLHLNYTDLQKEKLYVRIVQYGIDIYGAVKAGMNYRGQGGQDNGRKAAMVLAGLAFNDAAILEWADAAKHFVFGEDKQTFYITQADVGRVMYTADGRPRETYTQDMVGLPEWGEAHGVNPSNDASNWATAYYRWAGGAQHGNVLALRLTAVRQTTSGPKSGGMEAWNYMALFDYQDRYWNIESQGGQTNQSWSAPNNISPFVYEMWQAYRNGGGVVTPPVPPPPVVSTFAIGNRIETLGGTNVRATGTLSGTLLGTQVKGALGTIVEGPVTADNFTWWKVNYDTGADGWCGEDNFIKTTQPVPPTQPQGLKVNPQ